MVKIFDGKDFSNNIISKIEKDISPKLEIITTNDNCAGNSYIKMKEKVCTKANILCKITRTRSEDETIERIETSDANGIIVQLPIPWNRNKILNSISQHKDVDGLSSANLGCIMHGNPKFIPCTAEAVFRIIQEIGDPKGKVITIINSSIVVGLPLASLLVQNLDRCNATVIVCNEFTPNLIKLCRESDIVVSAVGKRPKFKIPKEALHDNLSVIDVGVSILDGEIFGDLDQECYNLVKFVTPKVGGIGPVTTAILAEHVYKAARSVY